MDLERVVADLVEKIDRRYYGKYRGIVVDNEDPKGLGRLTVQVPSVLGPEVVTGWAKACVPYGGADQQGFLFIPDRGAGVWVEFEEGDLEFPLWSGAFISESGGTSEAPRPDSGAGQPGRAGSKIIKTGQGHTLQFQDSADQASIRLHDGVNGHQIVLDADGVTVTDGIHGHRITLTADGVAITGGPANGNSLAMDSTGITVRDRNGNTLQLGPAGIQVGGEVEKMVLGTTFKANIAAFMAALSTHTHIGNLGAPTSPPVLPMSLDVPLSPRNSVG
ncbi:phage baseplate assembly protein V [Arthrobacter sp. I2-34]|uniref:Phage baseplate assembly protein V n=1 Tax=Arthrobacter hankyongi TaxID=2904801 RepID=A0ABS9L6W7_9MICC|nr:phage baseplate assembly protein V [Arthrobacter hankyongi]MCG2622425.1 phage baseplate assembly protein V [Arthrobacter hankyongi]